MAPRRKTAPHDTPKIETKSIFGPGSYVIEQHNPTPLHRRADHVGPFTIIDSGASDPWKIDDVRTELV